MRYIILLLLFSSCTINRYTVCNHKSVNPFDSGGISVTKPINVSNYRHMEWVIKRDSLNGDIITTPFYDSSKTLKIRKP
jgi:hypothetical protein